VVDATVSSGRRNCTQWSAPHSVGHEGGLRVDSTWRERCSVTRESAEEVELAFTRILEEHGK